MEKFQPEMIQNYLNQIQVKTSLIFLISQAFEGKVNSKEPVYGTSYDIEALSPELTSKLTNPQFTPLKSKKKLDLPPRNNFLPERLDILPIDDEILSKTCTKILGTKMSDAWYKKDSKFLTPRALINVKIYCKDNSFPYTPQAVVLHSLWLDILKDHMRESLYMADMANIKTDISSGVLGVELSFRGFNDSLSVVAEDFLRRMTQFRSDFNEEAFNDCYNKYKKHISNYKTAAPHTLASELLNLLTLEGT
jgi:insulysin